MRPHPPHQPIFHAHPISPHTQLTPSPLCHSWPPQPHPAQGQPLYKKLYETATAIPAKVQDTTLYKRGYPLVAPLVAPVADPVYSNFANSKVIKQLDEHLKPKTA